MKYIFTTEEYIFVTNTQIYGSSFKQLDPNLRPRAEPVPTAPDLRPSDAGIAGLQRKILSVDKISTSIVDSIPLLYLLTALSVCMASGFV